MQPHNLLQRPQPNKNKNIHVHPHAIWALPPLTALSVGMLSFFSASQNFWWWVSLVVVVHLVCVTYSLVQNKCQLTQENNQRNWQEALTQMEHNTTQAHLLLDQFKSKLNDMDAICEIARDTSEAWCDEFEKNKIRLLQCAGRILMQPYRAQKNGPNAMIRQSIGPQEVASLQAMNDWCDMLFFTYQPLLVKLAQTPKQRKQICALLKQLSHTIHAEQRSIEELPDEAPVVCLKSMVPHRYLDTKKETCNTCANTSRKKPKPC